MPLNSRLVTDEYLKYLSLAGESSLGDVTLLYPDNGRDNKVKGPVQRFKVPRLYDFEYKCLTCDNKNSMFDKGENITVIKGDKSKMRKKREGCHVSTVTCSRP